MSKLKILGDAVTITSTIANEELKALKKFNPKALKLVDEKTKEEIFAVTTGETAAISKYGITFPSSDSEGYASVTIALPVNLNPEEKMTYVRDTYGFAILNLNKLEMQVAPELDNFMSAMAEIDSSIEIL